MCDKYKLLLVDDEENNLALLYRVLRKYYEIDKTTSPKEAIELVRQNSYDLIISDHKMPEIDGVELLKFVNDVSPSTVKILLTAYSDASILIDAINYANIYRYIKKPFEPQELQMVVSASLEYYQLKKDNESLSTDIKDLFSGTIKAIIEALDAKDAYTMGRSRRVTFYSLQIAKKLNLSKQQFAKLELAGLLHDIGMIGICDDVLYKVEKLTQEEYNEIKRHVEYGVKILDDIKQLSEVVKIIKYHHEYYDGNGYPFGLKGEEIPLESRIIAVADAYDGMISNRVYRNALSKSEAVDNIKKGKSTQFDAEIVDTFLAVLDELDNGK